MQFTSSTVREPVAPHLEENPAWSDDNHVAAHLDDMIAVCLHPPLSPFPEFGCALAPVACQDDISAC